VAPSEHHASQHPQQQQQQQMTASMRRATAALLATAVVGLLATAASAALATAPTETTTPATAAAAALPRNAAAPAPPAPPPPATTKPRPALPASSVMPAVVVVGDGLTESSFSSADGFGASLQRLYTRRADVLNRGFGGFLTQWIANPDTMLPSIFPPACEERTKLAIVFLGVKDSVTEEASKDWGRPFVSPQEFEQAVDNIAQAAQDSGAKRIVLVTPPPVCDVLCSKPGTDVNTLARNTQNSQRYVDALRRVAAKRDSGGSGSGSDKKTGSANDGGGVKVRVLDIFSTWPKDFPSDWPQKYLHEDRLHLSQAGHARLLQDLLALLSREMPDVAPTPFSGSQSPADRAGMLPLFWPHMDDVDMFDPSPSFEGAKARGTGGAGACAASAGGGGGGSGRRALAGEQGGAGGAGRSGEVSGGGASSRGLRWMTAGLGAAAAAAAVHQAA
jgi:lysophospholipase L1-like esterase